MQISKSFLQIKVNTGLGCLLYISECDSIQPRLLESKLVKPNVENQFITEHLVSER